jgi:hypothetical protein
MRFPLVLILGLIVIAHCAASQTVLGEEPAAATDVDAALMNRIDNLLLELDAEEFQMRELASKKLGEIGEPARLRLMELAEKPPSPEVRIRVAALLRQFDLAALRRNAIKLDDFYTIVQQANADKLDHERLDLLLGQLVVVLRDATGNESLKLPVRLADVNLSPIGDRIEDKSLLITRRGQTSFVRNSIVLADVAFEASSIDNSIIIARAGVNTSSVSNSIIIAGYESVPRVVATAFCSAAVLFPLRFRAIRLSAQGNALMSRSHVRMLSS